MQNYCYKCVRNIPDGEDVCPYCGFRNSSYEAEPHHLPAGTILNSRFEVGVCIGEGGFGITYVGRDTTLDVKVAVKEFYMSAYVSRIGSTDTSVSVCKGEKADVFIANRDKVIKEARTLAKFEDERGIVTIKDFFLENNTAYIIMEFLEGQTLDAYIKQSGKLSWDKLYSVMKPVLKSLSAVHKEGIIHRDISPDNIMITDRGEVKLLDFGAARSVSTDDEKSLSVILKRGYAPEEQYRSKGKQGTWTDVYALCATMYKALTGTTPEDAMDRALSCDSVVPPIDAGAACSKAVSDVIMKGMAVRQENRYSTIPELCSALENALNMAANEAVPEKKEESAAKEDTKQTPSVQAIKDIPHIPQDGQKKTVIAEKNVNILQNKTADFELPKDESEKEYRPAERRKLQVFGIVLVASVLIISVVCAVIYLPKRNKTSVDADSTAVMHDSESSDSAWSVPSNGVYNDLKYSITNGEATITGFETKPHGKLVIPKKIDGYPVTKIANSAFVSCHSITELEMPNVLTVGDMSFYACDSIKSIKMPAVQLIGERAFSECHALTSVEMPEVQTIDNNAFNFCYNLPRVDLPKIQWIGNKAFYKCASLEGAYFRSNAPSFFGDRVFEYCADNFSIYCKKGTSGWSTPVWNGYKAQTY